VLVEVAYLSNQKDEELLKSVAYRSKIAESIAKGVGAYHGTLVRKTRVDTETGVAGQ
jgi:N-acetylmuramoyl-L-alanine amidase